MHVLHNVCTNTDTLMHTHRSQTLTCTPVIFTCQLAHIHIFIQLYNHLIHIREHIHVLVHNTLPCAYTMSIPASLRESHSHAHTSTCSITYPFVQCTPHSCVPTTFAPHMCLDTFAGVTFPVWITRSYSSAL